MQKLQCLHLSTDWRITVDVFEAVQCRFRWWIHVWLISALNNISVLGIVLSCSYTFALTMHAHAFNAPPSWRMIGHQCTNPHCGKVFTNVFAYYQHRRHAPSLVQGRELFARVPWSSSWHDARRVHWSTRPDRFAALLSASPRRGTGGDAHTATHTRRDEYLDLLIWRCPRLSVGNPNEFRPYSKFGKNPPNSIEFSLALAPPHMRKSWCSLILAVSKQFTHFKVVFWILFI